MLQKPSDKNPMMDSGESRTNKYYSVALRASGASLTHDNLHMQPHGSISSIAISVR